MPLAEEMSALLAAFYASVASGDSSAFEERFAPDLLVIGTDEAEWWSGKDEAQRVMRAQVHEIRSAGVRFTAGEPMIVVKGDVVWAADRPMVQLSDGTTTQMRLTAVAVREDDALWLYQLHASIGAPNEEVIKQELTL